MKEAVEMNIPGAVAEPYTEDDHHFQITVTASQFKDKTLIEQHRMVYQALGSMMSEIHALAIETTTGDL